MNEWDKLLDAADQTSIVIAQRKARIAERRASRIDTCHYCGQQYHPMPVYTRKGKRIHVCHYYWDGGHLVEVDECRDKALAEGYEYRRDLTPRR